MHGSSKGAASLFVVGYAGGAAREGFKIMGGQFGAIGANKAIDLTTIKVTGYDEATEADVKMQTLDYAGVGGKTYSYYDVPGELTGWLDSFDNEVEPGTVMIQPGEGMWTNAPSTDWSVTLPGVEL